MKPHSAPLSATSLPAAPHDESSARLKKYLVMMAIRMACFVLMFVVQPYGWYTWLLAAGAIFLPYFAVVVANVAAKPTQPLAESPNRVLTEEPEPHTPRPTSGPTVIQIHEAEPSPPDAP